MLRDVVQQAQGLRRCADSDRVAERDLVAAAVEQPPRNFCNLSWSNLSFVRAAEHAGDIATDADSCCSRRVEDRVKAFEALRDGAVDVLLGEALGGCGEDRDLARSCGHSGLIAPQIGDQYRIADPGLTVDATQYLGVIGHLRNRLGRDEGGRFDGLQSCAREAMDQLDLGGRGDDLFFVLQTVARPHLDDAYLALKFHLSSGLAWGARRFRLSRRGSVRRSCARSRRA